MKNILILSFLTFSFSVCFAGCSQDKKKILNKNLVNSSLENTSDTITINKMKITVGDKVFNVTLEDNPSTKALKALLPLTLNMSELNNNEKVHQLDRSLPANSISVGKIETGDFMLYGKNALVLFYESFSTSYTYTKLGKVDDISGFKNALGSGNVTIKFELQQ